MEWINIQFTCEEALKRQGYEELIPDLECITFGWKYHEQFRSMVYKLAKVFRDFSFEDCTFISPCPCNVPKRFTKFLDPNTSGNSQDPRIPSIMDNHVRTMDIDIIRDVTLRSNFQSGLNHIPLRQTLLHEVVDTVLDAWQQVCLILDIDPSDQVSWIRNNTWEILKGKASRNEGGFKYSQSSWKKIQFATDELQWIHQFLFIDGLDKATSNASFICINHIRAQTLLRLQGKDFAPCQQNHSWIDPLIKAEELFRDMCMMLPEIPLHMERLPYLMGTYKQHKNTYRWLTNAHNSILSTLAQFINVALKGIILVLKQWFAKRIHTYSSLLGIETSNFWIVDSVIDMTLNMPDKVHDIFVDDIAHCYEAIPLEGSDNLMGAIRKLISFAYRQKKIDHPKSKQKLWVRFDEHKSMATSTKWATQPPNSGLWVEIDEERLVLLNQWLSTHCFVTLGDRVWKQISGIPMGFSCSPLWCNLYFLYYEAGFVTRLAKLGRTDLMKRFRYAFRYINDLCILNNGDIGQFLDPNSG